MYAPMVKRRRMPRMMRSAPQYRRTFPGSFYDQRGRPVILSPHKRYAFRGSLGEYDLYGVYNEFGEYEGLLKRVRKVVKKVARPVTRVAQKVTAKGPLKTVKKALRKVGAAQAGLLTAGVVQPKLLGVKGAKSQRLFTKAGTVTRVAGAVVGTAIAAPAVLPVLAKAGTAAIGGLKFVGGKLAKAPRAVMDALTSKGIDPGAASPDQVMQAGFETGAVTPGDVQSFLRSAPAGPSVDSGEGMPPALPGEVAEGGVLGGAMAPLLVGGIVIAALAFRSRRKAA
jgi:hypothetical protein